MKPLDFPESNVIIAEDQPEYQPLPTYVGPGPQYEAISCWGLTWAERIQVLFTGRIWLRIQTFGDLLQPQLPQVKYPFEKREHQ